MKLREWRQKLYRVVRQGWANPLDASFSRVTPDRRWNTDAFEALYCCGSEAVARAVALDVLRMAGVVIADLQPAARPQLVEFAWSGALVDAYSNDGLNEAGFATTYPAGVTGEQTRAAATAWHGAGYEGVCCRSASLARMGMTEWPEPAERRCEAALWPANTTQKPRLLRRRKDQRWLR